MLELKNLDISLSADGRKIVDNFDLTLSDGDRAVVIGEEGNGKSTLLKCIYDRSLIGGYCDVCGAVKCDGRMAYLSQTSDEEMNSMPLSRLFDADCYSQAALVRKLLPVEFLTSERRFGELSGGEKVKVRLLRLLLDEPNVLLLDEPTNDLDISALLWLEEFLSALKIPVMFVSHDETLIQNVANVIVHMEQIVRKTKCRITVARCNYDEYLEERRLRFDRQQRVAQSQRDEYDKHMEKWRRIYNRVEYEQRTVSRSDPSTGRLLKKKMHAVQSMGRRFEREKENFEDFPQEESAIITRFEPVSLPSGKTVLDYSVCELKICERTLARGVSLIVRGGEKVGIIGANGVGKSTLLKDIADKLKARRDLIVSYMPQDYAEALDYGLSPVEYLAKNYGKAQITKARTLLGSMRFTDTEMTGKIGSLSGGQRAKLLFLDMVLVGANVLLLDEPTRNFSPLSAPVVRDALRGFGGSIISVSHDRKYLEEVCDTVYELTESGLKRI